MPRTGWVKPDGDDRLSDRISWGLLARVFPADLVDDVLAESGRTQQRHRLLPARMVVYYVMGLALYPQFSYQEVMRLLATAHQGSPPEAEPWPIPTKAALFKARARLGPEPLEALYARAAVPIAAPGDEDCFYRSRRLVNVDATRLDVPASVANDAAFGRPDGERGDRALPQVQVVGLIEMGTRAILAATLGGVHDQLATLAMHATRSIPAGSLVLAGPELFSSALWSGAVSAGADLLWQSGPTTALPVERRLADGSYLSRLRPDAGARRGSRKDIEVRIVEYSVPADDTTASTTHRLATTITDAARAPADELMALYSRRSTTVSTFDELHEQHGSSRAVLRSKVPAGVRQEVYGYLCVHYAIRWLMHGVKGISDDRQRVATLGQERVK